VLVPAAGMAALGYLVRISLVVVALLAIVALSYRQTLHAYPSGGGSYIVSRQNLGTNPSLVAAASLMVDYTLTVSVSVAAGVAAITSAVSPSASGFILACCKRSPTRSHCNPSSCTRCPLPTTSMMPTVDASSGRGFTSTSRST
jgi:amino acid transporter